MLDNSRGLRAALLTIGFVTATLGCEPNLPEEVPDLEPVVRVPQPVPSVDGDVSRNLLQGYIDRDPDVVKTRRACPEGRAECPDEEKVTVPVTWEEESHTWRLPYRAKRVVAALMIAAAHDRLDNLRFILTPDAVWGMPDPRRPGARPVFAGDDGEAFFQALRTVAQRYPKKAPWTSIPVPPGIEMLLATGAEPMWTYYSKTDARTELDRIVMRLVLHEGAARIDYVGLFEELPTEPPNVSAYGPPPPIRPPLRPPIPPPSQSQ